MGQLLARRFACEGNWTGEDGEDEAAQVMWAKAGVEYIALRVTVHSSLL
jgi:hypothetical protein